MLLVLLNELPDLARNVFSISQAIRYSEPCHIMKRANSQLALTAFYYFSFENWSVCGSLNHGQTFYERYPIFLQLTFNGLISFKLKLEQSSGVGLIKPNSGNIFQGGNSRLLKVLMQKS